MARGRSQKAVTDRRFTLAPAELQRRQLVFRPCETREELRDWLIAFLGVELPDCTVHPDSNSNPLDFIWFVYRLVLSGGSEDVSQVLGLSSRDSFKTFGAAVFEVLVLLHAGLSVVHLAAIEKQSLKAQEYVRKFLDQPGIREFADGEDNSLLDVLVNPDSPNADRGLINESLSTEVDRALETLTERERDIIKYFFGIGTSEMTLEEIGEKFDLTRERVRQIKEKAIRRLRHSSRSKLLKSYLG